MNKKISKILGIAATIALVASLLVTALPASALSQPQVTLAPASATIQAVTTYNIVFTAGQVINGGAGDQIVITFPSGTTVPAAPAATIETTSGIGGAAITPAQAAVGGTVGVALTGVVTMTLGAGQVVGAGALVGLVIPGIGNPATPGSYTLTVKTQTGAAAPIEAAVTSNSYIINAPGITPLPGIVLAYNTAGVLMSQSTSIITGIAAAGVGGRVEVGPGTYDENAPIIANVASQTIIATGDPGTVIISDANKNGVGGVVDIQVAAPVTNIGVTLDGFTITPSVVLPQADMVQISTAATYVTIQNCSITSGTNSAINVVLAGSTNNKIKNCTLTATGAAGVKKGIVATGQVAVSDTTITVGASGTSQAVTTNAGTALLPTSLTNVTITGSSGLGVLVTGGVASITTSTLSILDNAISVTGGTLTMTDSTVDTCGKSTPVHAINVALGAILNMKGNTVKNTTATGAYALNNAGAVTAYFNNFTGNTKNVAGPAAAAIAPFTVIDHNYWGATTGPVGGTVTGGASATPYLKSATTNGKYALASATLAASTTAGVDVATFLTGVPTAVPVIAAGKLDANPVTTAPPIMGTGSVLGYFDVYISDPTGLATSAQIKFYGAVTSYTKLYYAGGLAGQWGQVSGSGVNVAGGYAYCTITGTSSPSYTDMSGTPFALVNDQILAAPDITGAEASPKIGAYDVSINPTFTWGTVAGAIRYEIALSEDPSFDIIDWSYNVDNNFYKADESLRYDTTYYWRVRGVLAEPYKVGAVFVTPATPWATGIFTTEMEPAATTEPITVNPTKPEVNVSIPATEITVQPSSPAIPTYLLWVIVVVGAVLVIALIVLIVRTRRVV